MDRSTLMERAELEDLAAARAAEVARRAEAAGYFDGADTLWWAARRVRVQSLKLRALAEAAKAREEGPGHL